MRLSKEQNKWLKRKYGIDDEEFEKLEKSAKDKIFWSVFEDEAYAEENGEDEGMIHDIMEALVAEGK